MRKYLSIGGLIVLLACGCSKHQLEDYGGQFPPYRDYLPVAAGQLSYYRLDSTVTAPFGAALLIHSYLIKDSVGQSASSDGDTTFPVYRYMTDTLHQQPWAYAYTYRIILKAQSAERIDEQNRRFIILVAPLKNGYSWDGNRYFSSDADINANDPYYGWVYTYTIDDTKDGFIAPYTTIDVEEADVTEGNQGDFDPGIYQRKQRAYEIYDRQGLLTKEVSFITYQPNANNPDAFGAYSDDSFGYTLTRLAPAQIP